MPAATASAPRKVPKRPAGAVTKATRASSSSSSSSSSGVGRRLFANATKHDVRERQMFAAHAQRALKVATREGRVITGVQGAWLATSLNEEADASFLEYSPWVLAVPGRKDEVLLSVERVKRAPPEAASHAVEYMEEHRSRLLVRGTLLPQSVKKSAALAGAGITVDHVACQRRAAPLRVEK